MRPLALRVHGAIKTYEQGESSGSILLLDQITPPKDRPIAPGMQTLFMRFAFVIRGTERHFLPALAMDDWGNEIRKLSIYEWLYRDGDRYPRTELFGFEQNWDGSWEETQRFLREFELSARYPTYVVAERNAPPPDSVAIDWIGLIGDRFAEEGAGDKNGRVKRPNEWEMPLQRTAAKCWRFGEQEAVEETLSLN